MKNVPSKTSTAVCVSIDHLLQNRAPNRCLPFDGIGARCLHCDMINVTGSVMSWRSVRVVTANDLHNFPSLPDRSLYHHQPNHDYASWEQTADTDCYKRADKHTMDLEAVGKSTIRLFPRRRLTNCVTFHGVRVVLPGTY